MSTFRLLSVLVGIAFLKAGVWHLPDTADLVRLAANPFENPFDGQQQYLFTNWLSAFLAWLLHAQTQSCYIALGFVYSMVFMGLVFTSLRKSLPDSDWRKSVCIFMCMPVSWAHLYWIGYDGLTLALAAAIVSFLNRPAITLFAGVCLGLQHLTQGLAAISLLMLAAIVLKDESKEGNAKIAGAGSALVGICLGGAFLHFITKFWDIHVTYDRGDWLADHLHLLIRWNLTTLTTFLYCLLGPAWLIVPFEHSGLRKKLLIAFILIVCAILTFLTQDVTRVFAIISFPTLAFCLLYSTKWLSKFSIRDVAIVVSVWIIVPWFFDFTGQMLTSMLMHDVAAVSQVHLGSPAPDYGLQSSR